MSNDEKYMKEALKQAKKAALIDEVPIGCVIVHDDKIIARGYNKRNKLHSTLGHAEISAIKKASKALGDWRLEECTMYVTLEPCPMCAGATPAPPPPPPPPPPPTPPHRVVIGSMNPKAGCAGSILNMFQIKEFNHQVDSVDGVLQEECQIMMKNFFKELRERKKKNR